MKAIRNYLRLLAAHARADLADDSPRQAGTMVRYVLVLFVALRGVWLMLGPQGSTHIPLWGQVLGDGRLLSVTATVAVITAGMGVTFFTPLPRLPYLRFWSTLGWFSRSWTLPLLSLNSVALSSVSIGLLGYGQGLTCFALFYVAQLLAQRFFLSALLTAVAGAIASGVNAGAQTVGLVLVAGLLAGSLWTLKSIRSADSISHVQPDWKALSATVRKEVRYHRYFTSDVIHSLGSLAIWGFIAATLVEGSFPRLASSAIPLVCVVGLMPFSRVILNLLGMDAAGLKRLLQRPTSLVRYEVSRLRAYAIATYCLDSIVAVLMIVTGSANLIPVLAASAIATTELAVLGGLLLSFYVYEEKEMLYRYGQHLQSRSVAFSVGALFAIGVTVYGVGQAGGLAALAVAAGCLLYVNVRWLPEIASEVIARRRDHLLQVS